MRKIIECCAFLHKLVGWEKTLGQTSGKNCWSYNLVNDEMSAVLCLIPLEAHARSQKLLQFFWQNTIICTRYQITWKQDTLWSRKLCACKQDNFNKVRRSLAFCFLSLLSSGLAHFRQQWDGRLVRKINERTTVVFKDQIVYYTSLLYGGARKDFDVFWQAFWVSVAIKGATMYNVN